MKLHTKLLLVITAIVLTVGVSNAQVKQHISDQQLTELLRRIDASNTIFIESADKAMDRAGYYGSAREDQLNQKLKRFESAIEALMNDHSGPNARQNFITVLHYGLGIEKFLCQYPLEGVQEEWAALLYDLGELASAFGITVEEGHPIGAHCGCG
jgi:hypothetical protein